MRKSKIRRPLATKKEARVTIRHGGHSGRSTHPLCKHPEWPSNAEYRTSTICLRRQSETLRKYRGARGRQRGWQQRARVPDESLQPPRRQGPPSRHRVKVSASPACAGEHQRLTESEGGRLKWKSPLSPGAVARESGEGLQPPRRQWSPSQHKEKASAALTCAWSTNV